MASKNQRTTTPPHEAAREGSRDDFKMFNREDRLGEDPRDISDIVGGSAGEEDADVVAGGWAGTDDATSTAPSDNPELHLSRNEGLEENLIPEIPGGVGMMGAITDIKGTPVDDSRDWEADPIVNEG